MKMFLKRFLIFSGVLLVVFIISDVFITRGLKRSVNRASGEYGVWNDIYNGQVQSDMVVYGSSRAWVHFDPALLSEAFGTSCYNLGIDGHNFSLQNFRHRELLRFNKRPKVIIQSVDIFSFTRYDSLYNFEQFLPYMLFNSHMQEVTSGYGEYNFLDYLVPGIRYRGKKDLVKNAFKMPSDLGSMKRTNGYKGMEMTWNKDFENVKNDLTLYEVQTDSSILQEFDDFLRECKTHHTEVILVYSPEHIEGQQFVGNRAEMMQLFSKLANKYKFRFYDYSTDSICYQKKYFYNTQHLNKQGAELFTRTFINDLKKDKQLANSHALLRGAPGMPK
jgi:hypothetical protein